MQPMTESDKEQVKDFITIAVTNAIKTAAAELEKSIEKSFNTLNKMLTEQILNIKSLQETNKGDINNLFERQRTADLMFNTLSTNFTNHIDNHTDTKKTKWLVLSNIIAIIAVGVAVVAMLV